MVVATTAQQAQQEAVLSKTESLEAMKNLARLAIYNVAFLRELFESEHFVPRELPQTDGLQMHCLKPKCPESLRLVDWVEKGVIDALEKGYLRNVYFGFAADPAGTKLFEEYIFTFTADGDEKGTDDEHAEAGAAGEDGRTNKVNLAVPCPPTVQSVRYQMARMVRMLVSLCNTLDSVPNERYIFLKLTYNEGTPQDYEPPLFRAATEDDFGAFPHPPCELDVGLMDTSFFRSTLRIKTVLADGQQPWGPNAREASAVPEFTVSGGSTDSCRSGVAAAATPPDSAAFAYWLRDASPRRSSLARHEPHPGPEAVVMAPSVAQPGSPGMRSGILSLSTRMAPQQSPSGVGQGSTAQGGVPAAAPMRGSKPALSGPLAGSIPMSPKVVDSEQLDAAEGNGAAADSDATVDDVIESIRRWVQEKTVVSAPEVAKEFPELDIDTVEGILDGLVSGGLLSKTSLGGYLLTKGRGATSAAQGRRAETRDTCLSKLVGNMDITDGPKSGAPTTPGECRVPGGSKRAKATAEATEATETSKDAQDAQAQTRRSSRRKRAAADDGEPGPSGPAAASGPNAARATRSKRACRVSTVKEAIQQRR